MRFAALMATYFWLRDYRGTLTEIEHADVLPLLQTAELVNDRIRA
jgi:hypothetical protein